MWLDRVLNPGLLALKSDALPTVLHCWPLTMCLLSQMALLSEIKSTLKRKNLLDKQILSLRVDFH